MSKNNITPAVRASAMEAKLIKSVYKYLTFDNARLMLENCNLQFTKVDKLNDSLDITPQKYNFDYVYKIANEIGIDGRVLVEEICKRQGEARNYGVCSFGLNARNPVLLERYTETERLQNGICIEIDLNKTINCLFKLGYKTPALKVRYFENTENLIPYELFLGETNEKHIALMLMFATKNKEKWKEEKEMRLILVDELIDDYKRIGIYKSCITGVYFGKDTTEKQKMEIKTIITSNKIKAKLYD